MIRLRRRRTSRDKSTHDGTGLSGNLHGDSVGLGNMRTPVTSSNGNDGELGVDDGTSDGTGDFLGTLHSESDVSVISAEPNLAGRRSEFEDRRRGVHLMIPRTPPCLCPTNTRSHSR
jgi:hypothetical protein